MPVEGQKEPVDDTITLQERKLNKIIVGEIVPMAPATLRPSQRLTNQDPESVLGVSTPEIFLVTEL